MIRSAYALSTVVMFAVFALPTSAQAPNVTSVSPNPTGISFAGVNLTISGSGFTPQSTVTLGGTPLSTFFANSTTLGASIDPPQSTVAGVSTLRVTNPGAGGGTSNGVNLTLENPVPTISGLMPSALGIGVPAGSPSIGVSVSGGIYASNASIRINGAAIATTWVSRFLLQGTIPASAFANPGTVTVQVGNPAPGGGLSSPFTITVTGPQITGFFGPAIGPGNAIPIAPSSSALLFLTGTNFDSSAEVHVDGAPVSTIQIDSSTVRITLDSSLPQLQQRGGVVFNVVNNGSVVSNSFAIPVGGGGNKGTIRRHPLNPNPGQSYEILLENGTANRPLTLIADGANPAPVFPWLTPAANQVLSVRPTNTGGLWVPIIDGLGGFGPAFGGGFDANGNRSALNLVLPSPPVGASVTLQAVYVDPAAPAGYFLSWARRESL